MNLPVYLIKILLLLLITVIIYYDICKIKVCFFSIRLFTAGAEEYLRFSEHNGKERI